MIIDLYMIMRYTLKTKLDPGTYFTQFEDQSMYYRVVTKFNLGTES